MTLGCLKCLNVSFSKEKEVLIDASKCVKTALGTDTISLLGHGPNYELVMLVEVAALQGILVS